MNRHIVVIVTIVFLAASTPASEETLDAYIARVRECAAFVTVDMDGTAELAGLGRARLEKRPTAVAGWQARVRQDSTLPKPKPDPLNGPVVTWEWTVYDFGVADTKITADVVRATAIEARAQRRKADLVLEAGELYVKVWVSREIATAARKAVSEARKVVALYKAAPRKATEAEALALEAEAAGIETQAQQADSEALAALASMIKFGLPPDKFQRPETPKLPGDDPAAGAPEVLEAEAMAVWATKLASAARLSDLPRVSTYGSAQLGDITGTAADYEAGLRVTFDPFSKGGADLDLAKALADANASRMRAVALTEAAKARAAAARAQDASARAALASTEKLVANERRRLGDTIKRVLDGKGQHQEIVSALRRLLSVERQMIEARAQVVSARLRWNAVTGNP